MKISIEWFLLDNTLLNLCIFQLASTLSGIRSKIIRLILFSLIGAVYALLSLFYLPVLRRIPVRIAFFLLLAIPLREKGTSLWLTFLCVLLSAAMVGGAVLLVTITSGGTVRMDGTIVGTLPLRTALIGLSVALFLPRLLQKLLQGRSIQQHITLVTVRLDHLERTYRALIDTGNLLTEPISGLPVVLLANTDVPNERSIVYYTQGGAGVMNAARPKSVRLPQYGDCEVACYVAKALQPIPHADAVLPAILIPMEWRKSHEIILDDAMDSDSPVAADRKKKRDLLYAFRRGASAAARPRGGSTLHRSGAHREVGKGPSDRT